MKMNKEKLNELRSKISIPLVQAMKLLKQHDENIEQCIQAFHDENIKKICEKTGCDLSIIFEYYHDVAYEYNVGKVIAKVEDLMHRPIKLTIEENPLYIDKVGFFIWAEDENLNTIDDERNRTYFIPRYDFEYVVDIFASVFPIFNPMRKYLETSFDECSDNYFDHAAITEIISKIKALNVETNEIGRFFTRLIYVLEEKNEIGSYLVVFGNQ